MDSPVATTDSFPDMVNARAGAVNAANRGFRNLAGEGGQRYAGDLFRLGDARYGRRPALRKKKGTSRAPAIRRKRDWHLRAVPASPEGPGDRKGSLLSVLPPSSSGTREYKKAEAKQ